MNTGGEAAEQIVRMSLEGFEVAAKITGAGAKNIAILLYTILKEEKKTKGKSRLTNMLRSGKEALKGELGSMRDVLGEIQSEMYKSLEKNKPARNKEQER